MRIFSRRLVLLELHLHSEIMATEARAEPKVVLSNGDEEKSEDWYWQWVVHSTTIKRS